jgi:hypothetical protein
MSKTELKAGYMDRAIANVLLPVTAAAWQG